MPNYSHLISEVLLEWNYLSNINCFRFAVFCKTLKHTEEMNEEMEYLFSYGTLQLENVQIETYGRRLIGEPDQLLGYKVESLEIKDKAVLLKSNQKFHPIAIETHKVEDYIDGVIFEITLNELLETDKYEVSDYTRILKSFKSGKTAWIYCLSNK